MDWRERITDALMRMFTPESYGKKFGSPQDDLEGWGRAVDYQGRLRDATQEGINMPPDPRARGFANQSRRDPLDPREMEQRLPQTPPMQQSLPFDPRELRQLGRYR